MMDIKTILIGAGLIFVLWSCAGVNAQAPSANTVPIDSGACYAEIHGAVRADWAQLSRAQRALVGIKAIQACEGDQP